MLCQYGAIKLCKKLPTCEWQIEFCNDAECHRAKECLKIEGVSYTNKPLHQDELSEENSSCSGSVRESMKRLIPKRDPDRKDSLSSDDRVLGPWSSPPKGMPCARFCCHFLKYPTKILCLPRLVWWILIFLCAVATPFIAYAIAQSFGLDVYRVNCFSIYQINRFNCCDTPHTLLRLTINFFSTYSSRLSAFKFWFFRPIGKFRCTDKFCSGFLRAQQ